MAKLKIGDRVWFTFKPRHPILPRACPKHRWNNGQLGIVLEATPNRVWVEFNNGDRLWCYPDELAPLIEEREMKVNHIYTAEKPLALGDFLAVRAPDGKDVVVLLASMGAHMVNAVFLSSGLRKCCTVTVDSCTHLTEQEAKVLLGDDYYTARRITKCEAAKLNGMVV